MENLSFVPSTSVMEILTVSPAIKETMPSFMLFVRISGPFVSKRIAHILPVIFDASRMLTIRAPCSSKSPCEKFKRATFIPAFINLTSVSTDSLAGPIVHTIFVFFIENKHLILYFVKRE